MNTSFHFDLPSALLETILGRVAQSLLARHLPPQPISDWLRSAAAQTALRGCLLAALADTGERLNLAELPLFDEAFARRSGTVQIAAALLQGESREAVQARLIDAWREEFANPSQPAGPVEETAALFTASLEHQLSDIPVFRAILDSRTGQVAGAALADLSENLRRGEDDRQAENDAIRPSLERMEALLLLQPRPAPRPDGKPGALLHTLAPPPGLVAPLGEAGLLSQRPLVTQRHGAPVLYTGAAERHILAYSLLDGRLLWSTQLPEQYRMPAAFALWRDFLLVSPQEQSAVDDPKALLLLELKSGAIARRIPLPVQRVGAPLVEGETAWCVGGDGTLYAVDLAQGALLWHLAQAAAFSPYPPVLIGGRDGLPPPGLGAGGRLILPGNDPTLTAIDLAERRVAWRVQAAGQTPHFLHTPLVDGETVYAANWNGSLYALDAASGAERWRWSLPAAPDPNRLLVLDQTPLLAGDLLLVAGYDHHLYAVERATGQTCWRSPDLGRRVYSRPAVVGDVVYVGAFRRELHAFRLADGEPLWPEPLVLPDRVRGDLIGLEEILAVPLRKGQITVVQVALPAQTAEALLAAGHWQAAGARLVQLGRHAEAAQLYAAHGLPFLAAQQYERAGELAAAADLYSRDAWSPASWRRAATLYRQLGRLADAATLLSEKLADWPNAAQTWEAAGEWEKAAAVYATHLGEEEKAAQLYSQAGKPGKAADLYEKMGSYTQAIRILREAGADLYDARITDLMRKNIRSGSQEHIQDLLARTVDPQERAAIYSDAGEWTSAADEWLRAGDWARAVEVLVAHGHVERALALLAERREGAALARRAALLAEQKRWQEALLLYQQLGDLTGQAQAQSGLGNSEEAAHLWMQAARQAESAHPPAELRQHLADCYSAAAELYRQSFRWQLLAEARRKAHYYRGWPWLEVHFSGKPFVLGQRNVLELTVHNDGAGAARQVQVELSDADGTIRFGSDRPIPGIAAGESDVRQVQIVPSAAGEMTVAVRLRWQNPDGRAMAVALEKPWVVRVVDPVAPPPGGAAFHAQGDIHYYSGSVVQGDQMNISRVYGQAAQADGKEPLVGWRCSACGQHNASAAPFCDGCGLKREP